MPRSLKCAAAAFNVLQLDFCLAYPLFVHLCVHVGIFVSSFFHARGAAVVTYEKSSWVLCTLNGCTPTAPQRERKEEQGGPTEDFIQVAREMKSCKWLPVIVPIKEQLRFLR